MRREEQVLEVASARVGVACTNELLAKLIPAGSPSRNRFGA